MPETPLTDLQRRQRRERSRYWARQPRHVADILSQLQARRGYARQQTDDRIATWWEKAAGPQWSAGSRATRLRRGVLEVVVGHAALLQQLQFNQRNLLARVQAEAAADSMTGEADISDAGTTGQAAVGSPPIRALRLRRGPIT